MSHGIQVDCLKFDDEQKIADVWVRRQLTLVRPAPYSYI